ncbi:MAG: methyltransferase domain-containing protein [Pyrinomonadaceae bacterium]|nr:methyltransferase domain-containing protein [Pyrinomonadaceae bacterium]
MLSQDYRPDCLEVLIADGLSDDSTRKIVAEISQSDPRVRLIDNPARLMATGFNTAFSQARGDVILMLGGHAEMSKSYVSRCVGILEEKRAECVGGVVETVGETKVGKAIALAMSSSFGVGGVDFRVGTAKEKYVDTVAFGAYSREIIDRAGLLDERFVRNQDDEYNYRIRKLGARILLAPDINCRYQSRASLKALWRQYLAYGCWKVRVMQRHPQQMRPRHFIPMMFVSAMLLSLGIALFSAVGLWLFCLIAGSYLLANLAASVSSARSHNRHLMPLLPVAFAVLHFSYGFGFLMGAIRFWPYWRPDNRRNDEQLVSSRNATNGSVLERSNLVALERQRVVDEYKRRDREIEHDLYAPWEPASKFMIEGRTREAALMLHQSGVFPMFGDRCLEVGFGTISWLAELLRWGVRDSDLHGIDLSESRARKAQECLSAADLRVGDAAELPWKDETFDLVIASTLFTSILDSRVRRMVADEIMRVLAPGGTLLWYDFAFNNPQNRNVRKVDREELKRLFPELSGRIKTATLAPPIARLVARRSWALANLLETIPFLRTHLLGVLIKKAR